MTAPNSIPGLFESLKTYIRSLIQDKIDLAQAAASEAQSYRQGALTYRNSAQEAASQAASAATDAATVEINKLKGNAPELYDTLGEIAAKLNADDDVTATMLSQIAQKLDKPTSGTPSATTYANGAGGWSTPTNTTYAVPSQAEAEAGTATTGRAFSAQRVRQASNAAIAYKFQVVTAMPSNPDPDVFYFVKES